MRASAGPQKYRDTQKRSGPGNHRIRAGLYVVSNSRLGRNRPSLGSKPKIELRLRSIAGGDVRCYRWVRPFHVGAPDGKRSRPGPCESEFDGRWIRSHRNLPGCVADALFTGDYIQRNGHSNMHRLPKSAPATSRHLAILLSSGRPVMRGRDGR